MEQWEYGGCILSSDLILRWKSGSGKELSHVREDIDYHFEYERMLLLIGCDDSSLVIDKLCDEAVKGDPTVACFYFDFAARNEPSPVNMLGSLLRQLISGKKKIPEAIVEDFEKEKSVIGGRGLQVSGILRMFQAIAATRRTFICVDALDECVPEHRRVVLQ